MLLKPFGELTSRHFGRKIFLPMIYMQDKRQLEESRKLVLREADYAIPGHGRIFRVKK